MFNRRKYRLVIRRPHSSLIQNSPEITRTLPCSGVLSEKTNLPQSTPERSRTRELTDDIICILHKHQPMSCNGGNTEGRGTQSPAGSTASPLFNAQRRQLLKAGSPPGRILQSLRERIHQQRQQHQAVQGSTTEVYQRGAITRKVRKVTFAPPPPVYRGFTIVTERTESPGEGKASLQPGSKGTTRRRDQTQETGGRSPGVSAWRDGQRLKSPMRSAGSPVPSQSPTLKKRHQAPQRESSSPPTSGSAPTGRTARWDGKENTGPQEPQRPPKARSYSAEEVRAFMGRRAKERTRRALDERREARREEERRRGLLEDVLRKQRDTLHRAQGSRSPGAHSRKRQGQRERPAAGRQSDGDTQDWLQRSGDRVGRAQEQGRGAPVELVSVEGTQKEVCSSSPLRLADLVPAGRLARGAGTAPLSRAERVEAIRQAAAALGARVETETARLSVGAGARQQAVPICSKTGQSGTSALPRDQDSTSASEELPWSEDPEQPGARRTQPDSTEALSDDSGGPGAGEASPEAEASSSSEADTESTSKTEIRHLQNVYRAARQQRKLLLRHQREILDIQRSAALIKSKLLGDSALSQENPESAEQQLQGGLENNTVLHQLQGDLSKHSAVHLSQGNLKKHSALRQFRDDVEKDGAVLQSHRDLSKYSALQLSPRELHENTALLHLQGDLNKYCEVQQEDTKLHQLQGGPEEYTTLNQLKGDHEEGTTLHHLKGGPQEGTTLHHLEDGPQEDTTLYDLQGEEPAGTPQQKLQEGPQKDTTLHKLPGSPLEDTALHNIQGGSQEDTSLHLSS
ncbi:UNVERIFIED_CONTAM: hypothetical protein FKN15_069860 [Acipenser sinensis]